MSDNKPAPNLLFLELIIVIAVFSFAAAICVSMFVQARSDSAQSRDLTNAVIMAQNAAEIFKAGGGQTLQEFNENGLAMQIQESGHAANTPTATIQVYRESDNELIYQLTVAVAREERTHE
ncbi:MAG: type II secretion system GspH family protein [Oscillospiraceae bacterium]|nr:type II secretion system GspH family protein [Oscillospiraceae bacterium]